MERRRLEGMAIVEAKRAGRAFRAPFLGNAHEEIHRQMVQLRTKVDQLYHYSVYGELVQTSGAGKSRGVLEMSRLASDDAVFVCYCSLAGLQSTSFPPRTGVLAERLQKSVTELDMVLYLKAWLLVLERALAKNVSAAQWMEAQLPPLDSDISGPWSSSIAIEVREEWDRLVAAGAEEEVAGAGSGSGSGSECSFEFMEEIVDEEMDDVEDADQANLKLIKITASRVAKQLPGIARVVWVFDEALGLHELPDVEPHHSPFYELRRVLRVFFRYATYFALMLDTSAKLSNLLPSWSLERSDRALKPGIRLLPPMYFIPNLKLRKPTIGNSVKHYMNPRVWMQYGRPLWSARLAQDRSLQNLVKFASQKLLGAIQGRIKSRMGFEEVDVVNGKLATSQALALLSAAVGLEICPLSSLAELMVASHMNLLLRVSSDRTRIYVGLPVEPVLAEAAACVLSLETVKLKVLSLMEEACMHGYVTPGPRGEFVAKFILVSAVWALKKQEEPWHLRPISVDDYLEKLLVTGKSDKPTFRNFKAKRPACPDKGIVFFNSFVSVRRPPDAAMLGRCFAAGQAIMYSAENNLPGADLIIPVWTPNGMTCIVVSVKNLARPGWLEDVSVRKMKCEYTTVEVAEGLPVYTILMSLREPSMKNSGEEWNWILWDEKAENEMHVHLTCYGLENNYSFLSKEVKAQLKQILFTVPDALAGASDEEIRWIQDMLPEKFEVPDASFSCLPSY